MGSRDGTVGAMVGIIVDAATVGKGVGEAVVGICGVAVARLDSMDTIGKVSFILRARTMAITIPNDSHSPMRIPIDL